MAASDHSQFKFAAERYILDELPEQERAVFEEHFFTCASCAQEVEDLLTVRDGAIAGLPHLGRGQAPQKNNWFLQPWFSNLWLPNFALAAITVLGVFSAYQTVRISHMKAETASAFEVIATPRTIHAIRSANTLTFNTKDGADPLVFPVEWPERYDRYRATLTRFAATEVLWSEDATVSEDKITVGIKPGRLAPGRYSLKIYGIRNGTEKEVVAPSFSIQEASRQ